MCLNVTQSNCLCPILKCTIVVSLMITPCPQLTKCNWIICLGSFHHSFVMIVIICWLATEWTSSGLFQVIFVALEIVATFPTKVILSLISPSIAFTLFSTCMKSDSRGTFKWKVWSLSYPPTGELCRP